MKTLLIFISIFSAQLLHAGTGVPLMKSAPPKAETIGEIYSDIYDAGPEGFQSYRMTKNELAMFLSRGRFTTCLDENQQKLESKTEMSPEGGPVYCSGIFATTEGRVFKFRRKNKHFLEIIGLDGIAYLILGEQSAP